MPVIIGLLWTTLLFIVLITYSRRQIRTENVTNDLAEPNSSRTIERERIDRNAMVLPKLPSEKTKSPAETQLGSSSEPSTEQNTLDEQLIDPQVVVASWAYVSESSVLNPLTGELERCKAQVVYRVYRQRWAQMAKVSLKYLRQLHESQAPVSEFIRLSDLMTKKIIKLESLLASELSAALANLQPKAGFNHRLHDCASPSLLCPIPSNSD